MTNHTFYLSLGSNIGDREQYLRAAIHKLKDHPQIQIEQESTIYETDPVGYLNQDAFLNMALKGETSLEPLALFQVTAGIEAELGRDRKVQWGPRTVDIDILLYNNIHLETDQLVIPHPRMKERAFVLIPLAEIEPELMIPGENKKLRELMEKVQGEGVRPWRTKFIGGESVFEPSES